jgi:dTDP-4-dehydrorhamnose reductase
MREHQLSAKNVPTAVRPLLIAGGSGTLGTALAAACRHRGISHVVTRRSQLDLASLDSICIALDEHRPWAVINAAGWVRVDEAEQQPDTCMAVNAEGAAALSKACADRDVATVSFSSDLVFDGLKTGSYLESDQPKPLNTYGHSKLAAERMICGLPGSHLIVRTAAFFSASDPYNFAIQSMRAFARGEIIDATGHVVSPTYVPHLCDAVLDLLIDGEVGTWHLTNGEAISWADFAGRLAERFDFPRSLVRRISASPSWKAARPAQSALASERGQILPSFDRAIGDFAAKLKLHVEEAG